MTYGNRRGLRLIEPLYPFYRYRTAHTYHDELCLGDSLLGVNRFELSFWHGLGFVDSAALPMQPLRSSATAKAVRLWGGSKGHGRMYVKTSYAAMANVPSLWSLTRANEIRRSLAMTAQMATFLHAPRAISFSANAFISESCVMAATAGKNNALLSSACPTREICAFLLTDLPEDHSALSRPANLTSCLPLRNACKSIFHSNSAIVTSPKPLIRLRQAWNAPRSGSALITRIDSLCNFLTCPFK